MQDFYLQQYVYTMLKLLLHEDLSTTSTALVMITSI